MVDAGRVARLLRGIDERLDRLEAEQGHQDDRRDDELWLDALKYLFVTTIEACIDAAHHIVASERWAAPDTNAEAFRLLGRHRVIDVGAAEAMALAVGFRNVLVHRYADVDDDRVIAALDELDTFRRFVSQVSAWMLSVESRPPTA